MNLRSGQRRFLQMTKTHRFLGLMARRQYGKTTLFAAIALLKMMKRKNHTVIFGSAKLNLSREIVRKEAAILQNAIADCTVADAQTGSILDNKNPDDFAGLFEAQRLEFRYYHSKTVYSRTKVVALRPDSVGETGDLMCDEIQIVPNWGDVWSQIEPIVSSDASFRFLVSLTPPLDDSHYSYEMVLPPAGATFPISKDGNVYESGFGLTILRIDANDAYADGVPLYDLKTGEPLDPAEHRRRAPNKDAEDRNYFLRFIVGGAAACDRLRLTVAQERGIGQCRAQFIEDDADFSDFLGWLKQKIHPTAPVGLGFDVATTTSETSNPSVLALMEDHVGDFIYRACAAWKTRDPDVALERLKAVNKVIRGRTGGRAKAMAVDATNEKYFSERVRKEMRAIVPVLLIVASESIDKGREERKKRLSADPAVNWKEYSGDLYVAKLDDNRLTVPPEPWFFADHRLVQKDRGKFVCEPDADGHHGDTFDGGKLALVALVGKGAGGISNPKKIRAMGFSHEEALIG